MTEPHTGSPPLRTRLPTGLRRGRLAGQALAVAFVLFDVVLVGGALSPPAPLLWVVLVVAVSAQIAFFAYAGRRSPQPLPKPWLVNVRKLRFQEVHCLRLGVASHLRRQTSQKLTRRSCSPGPSPR